ncbi:hypothetical protein PQG02_13775 [Nostoc sp. UHCC 0926]|uniref:hypothetical protein n=1 Tax=unclassified Nostoc TaxID=2593658 RepID=UPI00235E285F|nr:hypothetical protein [Nostoc sp. UHCC 0926]WDD35313.1 hypothetical protein PQG02_13775 [Nostoc sp. UHCC 0926]
MLTPAEATVIQTSQTRVFWFCESAYLGIVAVTQAEVIHLRNVNSRMPYGTQSNTKNIHRSIMIHELKPFHINRRES